MTDRYTRQTILPGFGPGAAERLRAAHVMVIGAGALGCPAIDLLARAGVGRISIVDRDVVELSNLQRQTLFAEADVGKPKAEAAAARVRAINRHVRVDALVEDFTPESAEPLLLAHPRPGVVLDCTDNFETRYLVNDACVKHGVPLVYGGAVATSGTQMTILPGTTACLRCVFPDAPLPGTMPTCDTAGIFAPVSAMIGAAQAADAIKVIVDASKLSNTLLSFDLWLSARSRLDLTDARDPGCPCCGRREFVWLSAAGCASGCKVLCGRNAVQVPSAGGGRTRLDLEGLRERLHTAGEGPFVLRDGLLVGPLGGEKSLTVFADGRAIVGGTTDVGVARGVYARFVGA